MQKDETLKVPTSPHSQQERLRVTSLAVDMCMRPHKLPARLHLRAWISDLTALGACTKVTEGIVDTSCLMQRLAGSSYTRKE